MGDPVRNYVPGYGGQQMDSVVILNVVRVRIGTFGSSLINQPALKAANGDAHVQL
jgi:hypothetical protein